MRAGGTGLARYPIEEHEVGNTQAQSRAARVAGKQTSTIPPHIFGITETTNKIKNASFVESHCAETKTGETMGMFDSGVVTVIETQLESTGSPMPVCVAALGSLGVLAKGIPKSARCVSKRG